MFLGEFEHTVDGKGRLTLPAKFRQVLALGVVITRGLDGCLFIFPLNYFETLADRAGRIPLTHAEGRDFMRMLFSSASDLDLDKQGRILLPQSLREFAGLKNDVVVVGVNTRIEVWDTQVWQQRRDQFEHGTLDAEHWAQLGI
jgi:MraZ protein